METLIWVFENGRWTKTIKTTEHYKCPSCTKNYGDGVPVYHIK